MRFKTLRLLGVGAVRVRRSGLGARYPLLARNEGIKSQLRGFNGSSRNTDARAKAAGGSTGLLEDVVKAVGTDT